MSRGLGLAIEGAVTRPGSALMFRVGGFFPTDALYQLHVPKDANPSTDDPKASSTVIGGRGA